MRPKRLQEVIKEQVWYRGQIIRTEAVPPRSARSGTKSDDPRRPEEKGLSREILDAVEASGFTDLLPHEITVLRSYEDGQDILLGIPLGQSMNRLVEMTTMLGCTWLHGKVLMLCPNPELTRLRSVAIKERLKSSAFSGLLSSSAATDADDLKEAAGKGIDIVTTLPRTLYQSLTRELSASLDLRSWIGQVRGVLVYALDLCTPEEACHLGHMMELLRFLGANPRMIVVTRPVMSPEVLGKELLGTKIDACTIDTGPAPGFESIFWLPALVADPAIEPDLKVRVSRRSYIEELQHVTSIMPRVDGVRRILVWHAYAALSDACIRVLKNSLLQCIASGVTAPNVVPPELECVNDLYAVPSSWLGSTDILLALGLPRHCNSFIEDAGQLLRDGGILITFVPEDPLSNLALRDQDALGMLPPPRCLLPRSSELEQCYLDLMFHLSGERVHKSRLSWSFRDYQERLVPLFRRLIDQGQVVDENVAFVKHSPSNASPAFSEWPLLGEKGAALEIGGAARLEVEDYWEVGHLFDGALVRVEETLQLVRRTGERAYSAQPAPEDAPAARIPLLLREFSEARVLQQKTISYGTAREVIAKLTVLDVTERLNAYIEIGDFSAPAEKHFRVELQQKPGRQSQGVAAIHFIFPDAYQEFASLLWFFVQASFLDRAAALGIHVVGDQVVLFARHPIFERTIQELFQTVEAFLKGFLSLSYRLLNSCPCASGCGRCLKPAMHPFERSPELDKIRAMKSIGTLLGLERLDSDLKYKIKGLPGPEAEERYRRVSNLILEVSKDKLDLQIPVLARLITVSSFESVGVLGTYSSGENLVRILAPLEENTALEVIAHEYAHNWQLQPSAPHFAPCLIDQRWPHDGKIFLEGFAQWVAFKMDDFWGLADAAGSICLRKDDEYGDGFKIFNAIENEIGFMGTLKFAREGSLRLRERTLTPEEVLKQFLQ
jgi:hypothetical protein